MDRSGDGLHAGEVVRDARNNVLEMLVDADWNFELRNWRRSQNSKGHQRGIARPSESEDHDGGKRS